MAPRHNKHCTFKRTEVCICSNIEAALNEQANKHLEDLRQTRLSSHKDAVDEYKRTIMYAFEALIDSKYVLEQDSTCDCTDKYW